MLRLVLLSLAVAYASAIVCLPDTCSRVRCAAVTAENCVGGEIVPNGGFCGCCDKCKKPLAEGEKCFNYFIMGAPNHTPCQEGLTCDPVTLTCTRHQLLASRRQAGTCAEELQQVQSAQNQVPLLGRFVPRCADDGSYAPVQCRGSVCYCVAPNGDQIEGFQANAWESANMDCKCARDLHAYMQTGLIGKLFFCTDNGSYQKNANDVA